MTTIAYKSGVLAADSCVSLSNAYVGSSEKARRNFRGQLGAASGTLSDAMKFYKWLDHGCQDEVPEFGDDIQAIVVEKDGSLRLFYGANECSYSAPFYALGDGYQFALGAMHAGASATKAIEAAIALNPSTRGPVTFLELEPLP